MKLQCKQEKDKGLRILCNGTLYVVGADGALCLEGATEPAELPERDAAKLLQDTRTWEAYGAAKPEPPPKPARTKAKVQLLDSHGAVVDTGEVDVLDAVVAASAPTEPAGEPEAEVSTIPPIKAPSPKPPPGATLQECSPTPGGQTDPPIPQDGGEWADPKPEYSMAWLRACAKAYQIKHGPRSSAATLCQKITAAMYGSGEES